MKMILDKVRPAAAEGAEVVTVGGVAEAAAVLGSGPAAILAGLLLPATAWWGTPSIDLGGWFRDPCDEKFAQICAEFTEHMKDRGSFPKGFKSGSPPVMNLLSSAGHIVTLCKRFLKECPDHKRRKSVEFIDQKMSGYQTGGVLEFLSGAPFLPRLRGRKIKERRKTRGRCYGWEATRAGRALRGQPWPICNTRASTIRCRTMTTANEIVRSIWRVWWPRASATASAARRAQDLCKPRSGHRRRRTGNRRAGEEVGEKSASCIARTLPPSPEGGSIKFEVRSRKRTDVRDFSGRSAALTRTLPGNLRRANFDLPQGRVESPNRLPSSPHIRGDFS